jgi:putative peptidoglycan lipid II flippase
MFRSMAGDAPGLDLTGAEQLCLALGGTLGVAAFVAVPTIGLHRTGFRLRLGLGQVRHDHHVRRLLRLSGWAALQHSGIAILLAAALIVAGGVAGGVVAYQLAMVVFLAPYGIVAQPIHTAVLPRLSADVAAGDAAGLHSSLRWAGDAMAVATLPLAAGLAAMSLPIMSVLAFGAASTGDGPELLAAALLGLAFGVPLYGGFLLLTRAAYALGDSRTPAIASLLSAAVGAAAMFGAARLWDGTALLVALGLAHSLAYGIGLVGLAVRLHPAVGSVVGWSALVPLALSAVVGAGAWLVMEAWSPDGRLMTLAAVAATTAMGGFAYLTLVRVTGSGPGPAPAPHLPAQAAP